MKKNHDSNKETSCTIKGVNAAVDSTPDFTSTAADQQGGREIPEGVNLSKNHNLVARTLRNALTLECFEGWCAFSTIAAALLDNRELAAFGFAVQKAQTPEHAEMTSDAAIYGKVPENFLDTPAGRAAIVEWRERRDRRRAR